MNPLAGSSFKSILYLAINFFALAEIRSTLLLTAVAMIVLFLLSVSIVSTIWPIIPPT